MDAVGDMLINSFGFNKQPFDNKLKQTQEIIDVSSTFVITLGPADNEFGYNEHTATISRSLCIKIIDCSVKKFGYNSHPLIRSSFF